MSELLEAARAVLRLYDNPQDLGSEVYSPAYERLRHAIAAEDMETLKKQGDDLRYDGYVSLGGEMTRAEWERVWKLHLQYMDSDRLSPYEERLLL